MSSLKTPHIIPSRRHFILGMSSFVGSILPNIPKCLAAAADSGISDSIPLRLLNGNTGEAYDLEIFIGDQWNPYAVRVCDWLMRDWRENQMVQCDKKLYAGLYVMQRYFSENGRITINSGFRTEKTNNYLIENGYGAAVNSQHLKAKAVDFTIPNASMRQVARAVDALGIGGVGYYGSGGNNFVHMDARGYKVNTWADSY